MIWIRLFNGTGSDTRKYGTHMTRETICLGPGAAQELLNKLMRIPSDLPVDPFDEEKKVVADLIHALTMACCDELDRRENDDE